MEAVQEAPQHHLRVVDEVDDEGSVLPRGRAVEAGERLDDRLLTTGGISPPSWPSNPVALTITAANCANNGGLVQHASRIPERVITLVP